MTGKRWGDERRPPTPLAVWLAGVALIAFAAYAAGAWGRPGSVPPVIPARVVVEAPTPDPAIAALARLQLTAAVPTATATPYPTHAPTAAPTQAPWCERARQAGPCVWAPAPATADPHQGYPVCATPVAGLTCWFEPAPTGAPLPKGRP